MAWDVEIIPERRLCKVNNMYGYFHTWEHFSQPLEASPLVGGTPAGVFSRVYGIVELVEGVRRVEASDICFCDEDNEVLRELNKVKCGR